MIRLVDTDNAYRLASYCVDEPFAVRILALFGAYGVSDIVRFWIQGKEDTAALVAKSGGQVTVSVSGTADYAELSQFINVIGFDSLEGQAQVLSALGFSPDGSGLIMSAQITLSDACSRSNSVSLSEALSVPERCGMFKVTPQLYTDFSHRVRHGCADFVSDGKSTALAVSLWDKYGVLGAVATVVEYRNTGLASVAINQILSRYGGYRFYVLIEDERLEKFYSKFGFITVDRWGVKYG